MKKLLPFVVFFAFSVFTAFTQCVTNVNFGNWVQGGQPGNGNWVLQNGGAQVHQTVNGNPTFFLSPYDLMNVHISGNFRSTDDDNDWMGFVFSYLNPMGAIDSFDCWLYDWKQEQQGGASSGMSLCRVNGVIPGSMYTTTFWNHQNTPEFTVMQNNFGSAGWNQGFNHFFELYLTYTNATIFIDGVQKFNLDNCYKPGRFGFYNYSQKDCYYSNFQYDLYVDFDFTSQVCLGNSASFQFVNPCINASLAQYQSIQWTYGDGTSVTINNPTYSNANTTHTYTSPGTYNATLTVTDHNGCSATKTHTIVVASPIVLNPTLNEPPCNGGSNGSINLAPTGGFGNYQYHWSNNTTQQNLIGASAGTYSVTVTDAACNTTQQFTLNQPSPLTATTSHTDAPCGGNGTATIVISGGTPPYSGVNWAGFPGSTVSLPAGTWIADFHDANGCSALLQYTETIASLPCGITSSVSKTNVSCFGGSNGSITLTVNSTTPPVNISWSNGGTGATISNLAAGTYSYTVTDATPSHTFSGSVTITQPSAAMVASISTIGIACAGSNTGEAFASVTSGGVSPYNYSWSVGGGNVPHITNLSPGPVSVTITDMNGCTATASGTVSGVPSLTVSVSTTNDSCYHSGKGSAVAAVLGGVSPYTYAWNNFQTTALNAGLNAGTYNVTVTDANGCTATGSGVVNGPSPLNTSYTLQHVLCYGSNTGSFNVTTSGGTPGYTYTWSTSNLTGSNATGLAAGFYAYTVTDANGCSLLRVDTILQPDSALAATSSHTDVTCNGANNGTVTINVSGGTAPYTFLGNPVPAGTTVISNLAPNTYAGSLVDANGCSVALSETITEPGPQSLTVTATDNPCAGATQGTVTANFVNPTGSVTYNWNPGGIQPGNLTNLASGTYNVTASDSNNCSFTGSATISEPPILTASSTVQHVTCNGGSTGSINITANGGTGPYTYSWFPAGPSGNNPSGLSAGIYAYTVTDAHSCTVSKQDTIVQPPLLNATSSHTDVTCNGANNGTVTINVSGGTAPYTFLGNPVPAGTTVISNLAPNTYAGSLVDANGCSVALSETITEPGPQSLTVTATDNPCAGATQGTVTANFVNPTGSVTYNWNPGGILPGNLTNLASGTYNVTASDSNNCSFTGSATVNEPAAAVMSVTVTDALCFGGNGSVTANPTGGVLPYSYTWSNNAGGNSATVTPPAGSYTVTASDANGCNQTAAFTINQPTELTATENHTNNLCFGTNTATATVTVNGGTGTYTYQWLPNVSTTNTAANLAAGNYSVTASDANNCTVVKDIIITAPPSINITATATNVLCFGESNGTITASATGGTNPYNYTITPDGVTFQQSANGQFANQPAATYTVIVTDNNLCADSTNVIITEPTQLTTTMAAIDVSCYGYTDGQVIAVANGGTPLYNYTFSTGIQNSNGIVVGLAPGNYNVTVTDGNGCTTSQSATILEPAPVEVIALPAGTQVNLGESLPLQVTTNQTGNATYYWQPSQGLTCYDCDAPTFNGIYTTTYYVTAYTAGGCTGTSSITVTVIPNYNLYIPNAFTPNGDGTNDTWKIFGNMAGLKQMNVKVFNRIGEKVFESNDINFEWDGTYLGKIAPNGVYTYVAEFVWLNNHSDNRYKGSVTLLR
jgi:gliding motility-associated-like protein